MEVSGFTFIRNGVRLGYPFVESIRSALPVCDEFIVVVGASDDVTRERVAAIGDPKIRIVDTVWNPLMVDRGYVLAQQKMIGQFNCSGDWAFYIEGDEVLPESDAEALQDSFRRHVGNPAVEALYFDYVHFWRSPEWVVASHSFYRQEVRVIRNTLRSFTNDAIGFLVLDGKRKGRFPRAAAAGARLFHYGHARAARFRDGKRDAMAGLRGAGSSGTEAKGAAVARLYDWDRRLLKRFEGEHPAVMREWLADSAERGFVPAEVHPLPFRQRRNLWSLKLERALRVDFSKRHFTKVKA